MELLTNGFIDNAEAFNLLSMRKVQEEGENSATFAIEPLPRGFGATLGNAIRRTILSSIVGCCITYVKIEGLPHEYMAIDGVLEDSIELLLNLRRIKVNLLCREHSQMLHLSVKGERVVTAADFQSNPEVEIFNPEQVICTLTNKDASLDIVATVTRGRGFRMATELKRKDAPIGVITLDCNYSPVDRVAYAVDNTRVGSATDFEKLMLTIETDGTKSPDAVLGEGSAELKRYLTWITDQQSSMMSYVPEEEPVDAELQAKLAMHIDELGLSGRAANCLRNANIRTVAELTECSADQLMSFKNFGEKSLVEIVDKLAEMELYLKETE
ncbi:DNA-directed RNA polymerase subunit alpha [bacterium]|nr:DNA-directed RNA polymerase subunit alpha [bacterium]